METTIASNRVTHSIGTIRDLEGTKRFRSADASQAVTAFTTLPKCVANELLHAVNGKHCHVVVSSLQSPPISLHC